MSIDKISKEECVEFFKLKEKYDAAEERMIDRIDYVIEKIVEICGDCNPWEWTWEFKDALPYEELGEIESKDDIVPVVITFFPKDEDEDEDESMYDSYKEEYGDEAQNTFNSIFSSLFGFEDDQFYIDLTYEDLESDDFEEKWKELVKKVRDENMV